MQIKILKIVAIVFIFIGLLIGILEINNYKIPYMNTFTLIALFYLIFYLIFIIYRKKKNIKQNMKFKKNLFSEILFSVIIAIILVINPSELSSRLIKLFLYYSSLLLYTRYSFYGLRIFLTIFQKKTGQFIHMDLRPAFLKAFF